ncbi:IclR family transcriptional regulator [Citricoccus nitrophenolicus]|uniref:IclR family transcriptional regulator n=1 Tax=Citricoccus nitrophenolicus TaxID=863575 RepID=A0ABV0IE08_9MICC
MLSRVVSILRAFDRGSEELTATEVSQRTGLPASTCHRIMRSLEVEGVLEKGVDHRYHIGLWLWEVAAHAPRSGGLQQAALPFMQDLMDITGHPVHLAVREGSQAVFIERMSHWRARNARPYIGSHYPLHLTSVGLMLLAHAPVEAQEDYLSGRLEQRTPMTVTDPQELRRMLASIRSRGFAVSDRQVVMDAVSVAAPIRGAHGQVIAALSVNTPWGSLKEQTMAHAVQTTALAITRSMALNVQMNR